MASGPAWGPDRRRKVPVSHICKVAGHNVDAHRTFPWLRTFESARILFPRRCERAIEGPSLRSVQVGGPGATFAVPHPDYRDGVRSGIAQ